MNINQIVLSFRRLGKKPGAVFNRRRHAATLINPVRAWLRACSRRRSHDWSLDSSYGHPNRSLRRTQDDTQHGLTRPHPALIFGLALIAYAIPIGFPNTGWNWVGWFGLIPLGTALVGTCPLYSLVGMSTCRRA